MIRTPAVSTKVYSDLLEALYAATLDERHWQSFLSQLCQVTQSNVGILLRNDGTLGRRVLASGGLPASAAAVPNQEGYTRVDPVRDAFMRNPRTGILEVEDFLSHEQLARHAYYPTMEATGAVYGTCIVPCISLRRYDLIALWRGKERPRLEPQQRDLLTMLFPHIQCALQIHGALRVAEERVQNAETILDANPTASLVLNGTGKLFYMNKAAQRLVEGQDGLAECDGRLLPTQAGDRQEFQMLLAEAAGTALRSGAMALHRPGERRPLQLLVSPFRVPSSRRSAGKALVLVTDPEERAQYPDAFLRKLYRFTAAETEVANGMLTGFSMDEIAAIRQVSVGTVRSQLKSMLGKTGTRRQGELVRLLTTLPGIAPLDQCAPLYRSAPLSTAKPSAEEIRRLTAFEG